MAGEEGGDVSADAVDGLLAPEPTGACVKSSPFPAPLHPRLPIRGGLLAPEPIDGRGGGRRRGRGKGGSIEGAASEQAKGRGRACGEASPFPAPLRGKGALPTPPHAHAPA